MMARAQPHERKGLWVRLMCAEIPLCRDISNNEEAHEKVHRFRGLVWQTGDIARLIEGFSWAIQDRSKDLIKSGGE